MCCHCQSTHPVFDWFIILQQSSFISEPLQLIKTTCLLSDVWLLFITNVFLHAIRTPRQPSNLAFHEDLVAPVHALVQFPVKSFS